MRVLFQNEIESVSGGRHHGRHHGLGNGLGNGHRAKRFSLPFSRQQIADVLGLTIETVSRQFTRLKAEGIIDLPSRREVIIQDIAALGAEAGG